MPCDLSIRALVKEPLDGFAHLTGATPPQASAHHPIRRSVSRPAGADS